MRPQPGNCLWNPLAEHRIAVAAGGHPHTIDLLMGLLGFLGKLADSVDRSDRIVVGVKQQDGTMKLVDMALGRKVARKVGKARQRAIELRSGGPRPARTSGIVPKATHAFTSRSDSAANGATTLAELWPTLMNPEALILLADVFM